MHSVISMLVLAPTLALAQSAGPRLGGALDGAVVTPMKNDRLWVVIPTAKRNRRWSCGRASS